MFSDVRIEAKPLRPWFLNIQPEDLGISEKRDSVRVDGVGNSMQRNERGSREMGLKTLQTATHTQMCQFPYRRGATDKLTPQVGSLRIWRS